MIRGLTSLSRWNYTHYLFDYQFGFIKRGLIGETFRQLGISRSFEVISIISIFISVLFGIIFFHFLTQKKSLSKVFIVLALTSSATIAHFMYDRSRYDVIIYLLAFLGFYFNRQRLSYLLITVILVINLFIHEASFFFLCPLLIYLNYTFHKNLKISCAQSTIVLLITYLIGSYGAINISYDEHLNYLKSIYPLTAPSSVEVLHHTELATNTKSTLHEAFSKRRILHHLYLAIYLIPHLILLKRFFKLKEVNKHIKWAFLLSLSPLCLYPIALDHFRWWSIAILNIFLILGYYSRVDQEFAEAFKEFTIRNKKIIHFIIFLSLALGPIKIMTAFY